MEYLRRNWVIFTLWFLIANLGVHLLTANTEVNSEAPIPKESRAHLNTTLIKILQPQSRIIKHINSNSKFEETWENGRISDDELQTHNNNISILNSNGLKRVKRRAFLAMPFKFGLPVISTPVILPLAVTPIQIAKPPIKLPAIQSPPSSPVVKPPSYQPVIHEKPPIINPVKPQTPYQPFVPSGGKSPVFRPPVLTTIPPAIFTPQSINAPALNPIRPVVPFTPLSPSAIKPKPIQKPHIGPDSKGTYLASPAAVVASIVALVGLSKAHTSSIYNHQVPPNQHSNDVKTPPICTSPPQIQNGDVAHCAGTKAGHRCRMMCQRNYEPNVKSIQCVQKSISQAEWQLNGARCDYNVDPVCRDNYNRKVDWFVAYRVPKSFNQKTDSHLFISNLSPDRMDYQTDAEFNAFQDGNSWTDWVFDQGLLSQGKNAVGHTLSVLRLINSGGYNLKHALYSDQPPPSGHASDSYGHSKGVLVHDVGSRGLYMIHSQPKFPGVPGTSSAYSLAKGQIFVCVTLSHPINIDRAVRHVTNLHPKKYSGDIVLGRPSISSSTGLNEISLMSGGGTFFKLFSKSRASGDIYRLIADSYGSDIFVQTWRNGGGTKLPSDCPVQGNKVQNVELMKFSADTKDTTGWSTFGIWKRTTDHAKWLVGQTQSDNLFCVGDMNRMQSQERRWGGAICLSDRRVARAFRQLIEEIEPCPQTTGSMRPSTSWNSGLFNSF